MVHKKINYVLILLVVFGLTSCKKLSKEYTTVEFSIINPADGSPFVGVPVKIIEREAKNAGPKSSEVWSGKTDENGKAIYEFKAAKRNGYWYIPIIDESYFGNQKNWVYTKRPAINWDPITKDKYNKMEYEITYYGYLKQIIKNINCEGELDTLVFHDWTDPTFNGSRSYDQTRILDGCADINPSSSIQNWPPGYGLVHMGWHFYEWEVRRASGVTFGKDSLYIEAGGLGDLELYY